MPEQGDPPVGARAAHPGDTPSLDHHDLEGSRAALEELRNYPFFADDDDAFDATVLGTESARAQGGAPTPAAVPPAAPPAARPLAPPRGTSAPGTSSTSPLFPAAPRPARPVPPPSRRRAAPGSRAVGLVVAALCCVIVASALVVGRSRTPGVAPDATVTPAAPVVAAVEVPATAAIDALPSPTTVAGAPPIPTSVSSPTPPPPSPAATAAAAPTAVPEGPGALRQRAIARQDALRSVQLAATIDYDNGAATTVQARFARGGTADDARLTLTETYRGMTGTRSNESLQLGQQAWQRAAGEAWLPVAVATGSAERLAPYLFPAGAATDVALAGQSGDTATLRWYDPASDADVTLVVDRATAVPQEWGAVFRATGQVVRVRYESWDAPLDFPAAP